MQQPNPWWALVRTGDRIAYGRASQLDLYARQVARASTSRLGADLIARRRIVLQEWKAYMRGELKMRDL